MWWFGGFSGKTSAARIPVDVRLLWPTIAGCWLNGEWSAHEVRATRTDRLSVAVIGPCGIPAGQLEQLVTCGVPDDVAWRWPGSYTVVQASDEGTTIWTDVGGAWPIYTLSADGGVYWSSSSRALAGLTGNRVDADWLAVRRPSAPCGGPGRAQVTTRLGCAPSWRRPWAYGWTRRLRRPWICRAATTPRP